MDGLDKKMTEELARRNGVFCETRNILSRACVELVFVHVRRLFIGSCECDVEGEHSFFCGFFSANHLCAACTSCSFCLRIFAPSWMKFDF